MAGVTHRILATALCFGIAAAIALAATSPDGEQGVATAKPKAPPVVMVKKSDGSSVRGQLAASDGERLTINPAEGKEFGAPVEVPWSEVKSVSNGLTRQKALDAWKLEHKAELCDACRGDRRVDCDTCKGTGHDPAASADCKTCKGELLVDCPDKRCEDGKAPCPFPCMKLSEGSWSKPDASGKRWRSISGGGGTMRVSDGHVGEVLRKGKRGEQLVPCENCGKTGSVACPKCGADGKVACPTCKAAKSAADCAACDAGQVACKTCGETGLKGGAATVAPTATESPTNPSTPAKTPADDNDGF